MQPESTEFHRFRQTWESVRIVRSVRYSLFTFGDSDLSYYLICGPAADQPMVSITQGNVRITRPLIITAHNAPPELLNFFDIQKDTDVASCLVARTAQFQNLRFDNVVEAEQFAGDNAEEAAARINRKLDDEEEEGVAVLIAPPGRGGVAILRYCLERVAESTSDNLTELRERGFLA